MAGAPRTTDQEAVVAGREELAVRFDFDQLVARRLELGLSLRQVAAAVGISPSAYRGIEKGRSHHRLTLRMLFRLASILELDPVDLFKRPEARAPSGSTPDDVRLESFLHAAPTSVPAEVVARALGWRLDRVIRAAKSLETRLEGTAVQVTRNAGYGLARRPGILTKGELASASRRTFRGTGLTHSMAVILREAIDAGANPRWKRMPTRAQRICIGRLVNQDLLRHAAPGLAPTDDVLFSLGIVGDIRRVWD